MDTAAGALNRPWPAPAKLNRFLHIVGRRDDGYHLLQTAFQFLDVGDRLWFHPNRDGLIGRASKPAGGAGEGWAGVPEDDDLCVRAARLLAAEAGGGDRYGVTIRVDKRLPLGGGLGGGSSNAATTLVALNRLWRLGLSAADLAGLGLRLGADVPVFVGGRAAWAEGVGERLTALALDRPWFVVLVPPCQVATAAVFADPELTRNSEPRTMRAVLNGSDGIGFGNDCETVVFRRYPPVAAAAAWLGRFGRARMTGTGCCVFAAFAERAAAERTLRQALRSGGWYGGRSDGDGAVAPRAFLARGRNRSLLQDRLRQATIAGD